METIEESLQRLSDSLDGRTFYYPEETMKTELHTLFDLFNSKTFLENYLWLRQNGICDDFTVNGGCTRMLFALDDYTACVVVIADYDEDIFRIIIRNDDGELTVFFAK